MTVADGNGVQDPEGDKYMKVAGFGNRATDFVPVKNPKVVKTAYGVKE